MHKLFTSVMGGKYHRHMLLVCTFFLILIFRSWFSLNHLIFSQDQARDVMLMHTYRENGSFFIAYGPKASVGDFYLPPLYYQVMYWLFLFTKSDLSMYFMTVIVESMTPIILFFSCRKIFSLQSALVGSLVYLFAVQITVFGTSMWNPNMIPFLTSVLLFSSLSLKDKFSSDYWIIPAFLSVISAIHFHYQGVVLVPFLVMISILYLTQQRRVIVLGAALGISFMTFLPYLKTESLYGWPNTTAIYQYITEDHIRVYDRVTKPQFIFTFFPGFIERTLIGVNTSFMWLGKLIWFMGMGLMFYFTLKYRKKTFILSLMLILSILAMLRLYKGDKLDFYLGSLYFLPMFLLTCISYWNLRIGVIISVVVLVMSGYWFSRQIPSNAYVNMNNTCTDLAGYPQPLAPLIHNNDLIQLLSYCQHTKNVTYSRESKTVIDVCLPLHDCGNININNCNEYYANLSRLFKQSTTYHQIGQISNQQTVIKVGSVINPVTTYSFASDFYLPILLPNNPIPSWLKTKLKTSDFLY